MKVIPTPLSGLLILEPDVFFDARGHFYETYQQSRYAEAGIPQFVQDNTSRSTHGVLRGLHYQLHHAQGKLAYVTRGSVWDVAVDIRLSSTTFGQWFALELNDQEHKQLYIPPGFAHGFCVLSDTADFHYKCTNCYLPDAEHGIFWNDAALNIPWPIQRPLLSPKDQSHPVLADISHEKLFP